MVAHSITLPITIITIITIIKQYISQNKQTKKRQNAAFTIEESELYIIEWVNNIITCFGSGVDSVLVFNLFVIIIIKCTTHNKNSESLNSK